MAHASTSAPRPFERSAARDWLVAVPAGALLVVGVVLTLSHGGYAPTAWYPAALFVLALGAVVLTASAPEAAERWRGARLMLVSFGLFTAWSYASIAWAAVPGLAWDGANRTLLYWLVLAIAALRPWTPVVTRGILLALVTALSAIAIGVLVSFDGNMTVGSTFFAGRLAAPTGYANATANLWLIGCFPALWLACDSELSRLLRGLCLAAAGLLAQTTLLSQSRGSVVAFAAAALVLVVMAPRRWPALLAIAATIGAVLASSGAVLDVESASPARSSQQFSDARQAIALATLGLLVVGLAAAMADRPLTRRLPAEARRHGDRALGALAVLAVVGVLIAIGNPVSWTRARWDDFKTNGYAAVDTGPTRFGGSLGSNRYDFYRVGIDEFLDHPLHGVGVDGFGPGYLVRGHSSESPKFAHSLVISVLAETGIIGTALFVVFLTAAAAAALRARRAARAVAGGPWIAAGAGATAFLAGCAVDWLWQFTALGVFAFLLLGAAVRPPALDEPGPEARATQYPAPGFGAHSTPGRAVLVVAGLAAALSLALPGIAARFTADAYDRSATSPADAVRRLDRAASYNRLSADAPLAKAIILRRLDRIAQARTALDKAISREPNNWFAYLERAMLAARSRDWAAASADIRRARALDPRQPVLVEVARSMARHRPVDPARVEADLAAQVNRKLHPSG